MWVPSAYPSDLNWGSNTHHAGTTCGYSSTSWSGSAGGNGLHEVADTATQKWSILVTTNFVPRAIIINSLFNYMLELGLEVP